MKYKIEIWIFHEIVDTFESNTIDEILEWYREEYKYMYDNGDCTFYVYLDDKELDFEETYKLGFFID